jgi:hypothetical protein
MAKTKREDDGLGQKPELRWIRLTPPGLQVWAERVHAELEGIRVLGVLAGSHGMPESDVLAIALCDLWGVRHGGRVARRRSGRSRSGCGPVSGGAVPGLSNDWTDSGGVWLHPFFAFSGFSHVCCNRPLSRGTSLLSTGL